MRENWKPHQYQVNAVKFIISKACAGLLLDPGLGKTSIMLQAFKIMQAKGYVKKMLVVAPLRVALSTWPKEVAKWEAFSGLKLCVLHGMDKRVENVYQADVVVINPEGLGWLFHEIRNHWPFDVLCVDESTRFKHTRTKRFDILKQALPRFARRYILTGSPAPNGLLDLFGQVFILDLGRSLGRYITEYRTSYFRQSGYGGYTWLPKHDAAERIYKSLAPLCLRMAAKDYLDLPPLVFNPIEVELPPEARRIYREMENLLIAEIKANKVLAANAAVAAGKCRQIANGGLYDQDPTTQERYAHVIHEAKLDAVEEVLGELQGTPALITYEFDHDRERLAGRFGDDLPFIAGGVAPRRFREIEDAWNNGDLPILLAQPSSVAHGLNLQGTEAHVIEHSSIWNLEDRDQTIQRVHRQGQTKTVVVHTIIAKDTVDEVIRDVLKGKARTQNALLNALNTRFK
jgi:SNF2 family DNA or RNA helicase